MLKEFNLLVSTSRLNEKKACSELWYLLREVGDNAAVIEPTTISGLIRAKTKLDPIEGIQKLRMILLEKPWEFRYVLKINPIQTLVTTDLETITCKAVDLAKLYMKDAESFRITVEKRGTQLHSKDIIDSIAPSIHNKVDLVNPDKIILIEIIGLITGISVISPDSILSVEKEKRAL